MTCKHRTLHSYVVSLWVAHRHVKNFVNNVRISCKINPMPCIMNKPQAMYYDGATQSSISLTKALLNLKIGMMVKLICQ